MYQCVNKIWYPPCINVWIKYGTHHVSMCGGYHILFTHWYVVGVIFCSHIDKWWVPYFIHTLIHGGCHILFTHWYMVCTIFCSHVWIKYGTHHDQCVNKIWHPPCINMWIKWWVPYFIHTLIHGGYHILFTHWYVVGAIFYSHIDTWWVPYFVLAPTTYQCVNKIWYPPLINVRTKYGTHHLSMCE
jgi:hypothetical protein